MSRFESRKGQAGFTLIELLIVLLLSSVVLIPLFGLMNQTYLRLRPAEDQNVSSAQLRVFRMNLLNDWSRARVIRINSNPASPTAALPEAKMDCRGGTYPWFRSSPSAAVREVRPAIAIHAHVAGNNTGRRIVYSIIEKSNGKIDIVRRECGHLPEDLPIGELDPWKEFCPGSGTNSAICTVSSEEIIIKDATALRLPTACNNGNAAPPYTACDANVTLIAKDGQSTTPRLYQPVVSAGRMVGGLMPSNIIYDTSGRPS